MGKKKVARTDAPISFGGVLAAAFMANAITMFAQDIVEERVKVHVTFERVKR